MFTDLILAIAHHLLMFGLLAVLVMELMIVRRPLDRAAVGRLARLDMAYGLAAIGLIAVGTLRVFFGLKGAEFYLTNPFFWAKMAAFVAVGALSAPPTIRILAWRRASEGSSTYSPPAGEVAQVARLMHLEATVFLLIPVFAALMARGYGL